MKNYQPCTPKPSPFHFFFYVNLTCIFHKIFFFKDSFIQTFELLYIRTNSTNYKTRKIKEKEPNISSPERVVLIYLEKYTIPINQWPLRVVVYLFYNLFLKRHDFFNYEVLTILKTV